MSEEFDPKKREGIVNLKNDKVFTYIQVAYDKPAKLVINICATIWPQQELMIKDRVKLKAGAGGGGGSKKDKEKMVSCEFMKLIWLL